MTHTEDLKGRIEKDFKYHEPRDEDAFKYVEIRAYALTLARVMVNLCPPSRDLSTALTRVEEAVFHANAAIARHGE